MKLVTGTEMAELDRRSIDDYGYPGLVLMENAGLRMFEAFEKEYAKDGKHPSLVFLAGGGNNGGDALVMARQAFIKGYSSIQVLLLGGRFSPAVETHLAICRHLGVHLHTWGSSKEGDRKLKKLLAGSQVFFDGLTGTGLKGSLSGKAEELVAFVNTLQGMKIALDVPSGIGDAYEEGWTAFQADITLTVGLPKLALYRPPARPFCGNIRVMEIGFPPKLLDNPQYPGELLSPEDLPPLLPRVSPAVHKYRRGSLCIFAGSPGTSGAARLTSEAAARSSAGLVTLMLEEKLYGLMAGSLRSVIGRPWDPAKNPEMGLLSKHTALCVGPGWGMEDRETWLRFCMASGRPGVLDADGITLLSRMQGKIDFHGSWILTPHAGECRRLPGVDEDQVHSEPWKAATEVAKRYNALVLLKGPVTTLARPDGRFFLIDGMEPSLATAGSGDVLAGLAGGLLAAGYSAEDAGKTAALVHLQAGRLCFREKGWYAAEDLLPVIPRILAGIEEL
ncbi:MAG: NAD(P)H-hydrate dehydratase [Spirochaetales bacterium]|nr:NAD(P)H-hydrate dehydratase [Spirochaetales bacterium]